MHVESGNPRDGRLHVVRIGVVQGVVTGVFQVHLRLLGQRQRQRALGFLVDLADVDLHRLDLDRAGLLVVSGDEKHLARIEVRIPLIYLRYTHSHVYKSSIPSD